MSRKYVIDTNDKDHVLNGAEFNSVFQMEQATTGIHGVCRELVYDINTDSFVEMGSFLF